MKFEHAGGERVLDWSCYTVLLSPVLPKDALSENIDDQDE